MLCAKCGNQGHLLGNDSDNLDNENGSMRLIRMLSLPRVVAEHLQRANDDKVDDNLDNHNKGGNKQKFNEINWFAIRAKGGGWHALICNIQCLSFIH